MIIDLNPTESNPSSEAVNPAPESQPATTGLLVTATKRQQPRRGRVRAAVRGGVQGALIVTALAVATSAQGADVSWNGGSEGDPNSWGNTNNWVDGNLPQSSDTAVFGSPVGSYTVDLGGDSVSVDTVAINSSASYNFSNGSLGLGSGVQVLQGSHSMDCYVDLLGSTSDWNISSGASLQVNGEVDGSSALQKSGAGTLTLAAVNSYDGGTTLTAGTLAVSSDSNLGSGSLSFGGNATLHIAGTFVTSKAITLASSQNFIEVDGGKTLTVHGVVSGSTGTFAESGGGHAGVDGQQHVQRRCQP